MDRWSFDPRYFPSSGWSIFTYWSFSFIWLGDDSCYTHGEGYDSCDNLREFDRENRKIFDICWDFFFDLILFIAFLSLRSIFRTCFHELMSVFFFLVFGDFSKKTGLMKKNMRSHLTSGFKSATHEATHLLLPSLCSEHLLGAGTWKKVVDSRCDQHGNDGKQATVMETQLLSG